MPRGDGPGDPVRSLDERSGPTPPWRRPVGPCRTWRTSPLAPIPHQCLGAGDPGHNLSTARCAVVEECSMDGDLRTHGLHPDPQAWVISATCLVLPWRAELVWSCHRRFAFSNRGEATRLVAASALRSHASGAGALPHRLPSQGFGFLARAAHSTPARPLAPIEILLARPRSHSGQSRGRSCQSRGFVCLPTSSPSSLASRTRSASRSVMPANPGATLATRIRAPPISTAMRQDHQCEQWRSAQPRPEDGGTTGHRDQRPAQGRGTNHHSTIVNTAPGRWPRQEPRIGVADAAR